MQALQKSVNTHVVNEMGNAYSHLRVLICTSAFGMGINCQGLYRSIHFGTPDTIETLIQKTGRVGQGGTGPDNFWFGKKSVFLWCSLYFV